MISGRRIVLGVTGGVAAYKAAYIARRLIERGASLRVVMTESATRFIGPATFAAITGEQPVMSLFDDTDASPHTSLARWADAIVIAPATASTISRIATGQSSDALVATIIACQAPVVIAPAMHTEMWEHASTQRNIDTLRAYGYRIVGPEAGELAGGDVGVGRLADPESIIEQLDATLGAGDMAGISVLVTAGGTREAIDPVRYIGNRSSGKMGNAIALEAADRGASVHLVTTAPAPEHPAVHVHTVETADEMHSETLTLLEVTDIAVMAAAVADFRPMSTSDEKLKRTDGMPDIQLEPTPDVLRDVVASGLVPTVVGFAAEAGSVSQAKAKAETKDVDLLVANDIAKAGSGFGSDTNEVTLILRDGTTRDLPLMTKREVAAVILDTVRDLRS